MYSDSNPHPRFAALLDILPTRAEQDRDDVPAIGITESGALVTAEYDDGESGDGETMDLRPYAINLDHGPTVVTVFASGNFSVLVKASRFTKLVEQGRPVTL